MMEAWWPIIVILAAGGALVVLASRIQGASYRSYLDKQVAETAKMVESQRQTLDAVTRQTAALERIAAALEKR